VGLANRLELLVILEAEAQGAQTDALRAFWRNIAACFRDRPNVFFAARSLRFADVIRQSGAGQPVIITDSVSPRNAGGDLIYQVTPRYAAPKSRHFGMAEIPVLTDGLDPEIDRASGECAAFPADPGQASDLVESILTGFDEQKTSLSFFTPGKLISDYRYFIGTKLDSGWTCGRPEDGTTGTGLILLSHFWSTTPLGRLALGPASFRWRSEGNLRGGEEW
jgi:hypothetical protein